MVRAAGVEPTTFGSGGRRSVQLSYARASAKIRGQWILLNRNLHVKKQERCEAIPAFPTSVTRTNFAAAQWEDWRPADCLRDCFVHPDRPAADPFCVHAFWIPFFATSHIGQR
jgi:hypothetical protein